jgi:RNA polymerase sigma-70 factor (ECF subfamily)
LTQFEAVVQAELPVLYRVARRLTSQPQDAEDLVGQALLLAARAWASFDGAHPRSWLLRILKNAASNARRAQHAVLPLEDRAHGGDTFEEVANRLAAASVLEYLDRLPIEYRLAVALCDLEGIDQEEAAQILEIPSATLRSRLHRGRKILRTALRGYSVAATHPKPSLTRVQTSP